MKIKLALLSAFLLMGHLAFCQTAEKDSINVLSVSEFERMATKKNNLIIDVRTPEEYAEGHLKHSLNVNFLSENFAEEIGALDKKNTYLLHCKTGVKSRKAADLMEKAGFKHVYMLDGGIAAWNQAGKPIEK